MTTPLVLFPERNCGSNVGVVDDDKNRQYIYDFCG